MTENKRFSYSEVMTMTNNFQRILGKGGFGIVYYGFVNDTKQVAVKILSHSSSQGYKQFKAEVNFHSHQYLVRKHLMIQQYFKLELVNHGLVFRSNFFLEFITRTWSILLGIATKERTWLLSMNTCPMEI